MARGTRTDYVAASVLRLEESRLLIEDAAFPGAIYYSGLAAESILKAFIDRKSEEIKGHNLKTLATYANMSRRLKPNVRAQVDAAITEASPMWRNLFRYSGSEDLDRMAKELKIGFEVESKLVKYSDLGADGMRLWSERLYNLASLIVQEGLILWQSNKR